MPLQTAPTSHVFEPSSFSSRQTVTPPAAAERVVVTTEREACMA